MTIKNLNTTIFSLVGFLLLAYLGLVINLITNVVGHQQAISKLSKLSPSVATLESENVKLLGGITIDRAYELGFKDAPESSYALLAKSLVY